VNPRFPLRLPGFLLLLAAITPNQHAAELTVTTTLQQTGEPIPARLHLTDPDGRPVRASSSLPFWHDHVSSPGEARFEVVPGEYSLTVERGPEWSSESLELELPTGVAATNVTVALRRLVSLPDEGWWPGETHIHRPIAHAELLMRAEDLHFGQFISWWNATNPWNDTPLPSSVIRPFDENRFLHSLAGEDERDGGALLFFNLDQPIDITSGRRHHPSSLLYARQAQAAGAWIDIEKPFWWDVPMWIAHGIGDSIGIANNHLHRGGVLGNEAWGRSRDMEEFPGPRGNGRWTQEIYYHLLNCGIRLPPSAGSASGVLPNPVGYNRVYVRIDGEPSRDKWFDGLKTGRAFVSNGPLLRVTANDQHPGHVFQTDRNSLDLAIEARLDSRDPIERIELVRNGLAEVIELPAPVTIQESGWFLVRAVTTLTNTLRFAATGPFYVELNGTRQSPHQHESAAFFLEWCEERIATLTTNSSINQAQREEVLAPWREARAFWQTKMDEATPRGSQYRPAIDESDAAYWLNTMLEHHFTRDEMRQVTGFNPEQLTRALGRLPPRESAPANALRILPYPGGRHPRIGFLEGALSPQRETKVSVFTPWDPDSYVVVDVPEALWSNLGLTYLAHTHIDTIWDRQGVALPRLEWTRHPDGSLSHQRVLPNGIAFGAKVVARERHVEMELWLRNGTAEKLTDLRVHNCVMLKGAAGFAAQSNTNRRLDSPFAAARSADGKRWIITAWEHCHRPWANAPVPCIHSDPRFPDLEPGEEGRLRGWLWFYESRDLNARLDQLAEEMRETR
jgi:hypothetical protein